MKNQTYNEKKKEQTNKFVKSVYHKDKSYAVMIREIQEKHGHILNQKTIRNAMIRTGLIGKHEPHRPIVYKNNNKRIDGEVINPIIFSSTFTKYKGNAQRIIVTSCQHQTKANKTFLDNLKTYIKHNKIDTIFLIPMFGEVARYTEQPQVSQRIIDSLNEIKKLDVVIVEKNLILNENVSIANPYQLPTQVDPLVSLDMFSHQSGLTMFGGTKIGFRTIANRKKVCKIISSSGALTVPNYRNNKKGNTAKEKHSYGFTRVDLLGAKEFINYRTVEILDSGSISDLDKIYINGEVKTTQPFAVVSPDIHVYSSSKKCTDNFFDFVEKIKPKNVFIHDLFDGKSICHHDADNLIIQYHNALAGLSFKKELDITFKFLNDKLKRFKNITFQIVRSNHDLWINHWVNKTRNSMARLNPIDLKDLFALGLKRCDEKENLLEECYLSRNGELPKNLIFLSLTEHVIYKGIEHAMHFYDGINGAKCSPIGLSRRGNKATGGDKHSPGIYGDVYWVGVAIDKNAKGYWSNNGLSGWLNACSITHANGTRQMIVLYNPK